MARCLAALTPRLYKPTSAAGGVEHFLRGHNQGLDNLMIQIQLPVVRFLCHTESNPERDWKEEGCLDVAGKGGKCMGWVWQVVTCALSSPVWKPPLCHLERSVVT